MPALPIASTAVSGQIVITASRAPEPEAQTPASVTIIDRSEIERLGQPLVPALLRLAPSVAVASSGPPGSFTEVRIRGAENNHTLLFIDGIRANDPATGDFARFELLNADLASRIEVLRGPQSALWGSDAIGGVVAVNGLDDAPGYAAGAEAGSFGFRRANASGAIKTGDASLSGAVGWQRSTGIDSFGAPGGDKDGYRNLSGRVRGTAALGSDVRLGAAAFAFTGHTQFDGYDPITFEHTDTLDNTRNRLAAGRIWAEFGGTETAWSGRVGVLAARLVEPQLPRERAAQPDERIAAHDRCAARASLRNRPGPTPADPCRRSRKREIPCSRPQLRPVDGPGPRAARTRPSPPSGLVNARALPATSRSAVTFSIASRTRRPCVPLRKPSSAAASPWPDPTPRAWPNRPSSTCTEPSRIISWVIRILGRKPRGDSKGRFVSADRPSMPRSPPIGSGFTTKSSTSSISRHSCPPRATAPPSAIVPGSRPRLAGSCPLI